MSVRGITRDTVLKHLNGGARTIWDLGSLFGTSAADVDLKAAVNELLADGTVTASTSNLFSATLTVAHSPDI